MAENNESNAGGERLNETPLYRRLRQLFAENEAITVFDEKAVAAVSGIVPHPRALRPYTEILVINSVVEDEGPSYDIMLNAPETPDDQLLFTALPGKVKASDGRLAAEQDVEVLQLMVGLAKIDNVVARALVDEL